MATSLGMAAPARRQLQELMRIAEETDRVLVLVYLDGGNDGLNTVVPLDQMSNLSAARPHVILPENSLHQLEGTQVGLHPSLSGFKSLFDEGRLKIIQGVGYPNPNYSHFRSTDIWMSGSDANEYVNSGWTGRYLQNEYPAYPEGFPNTEMTDPLAIEVGYGASLLFQGPTAAMSMVISGPESFHELVDNVEQPVPNTQAGEKLRYVRLVARQSQQYGEVVVAAAEAGNNIAAYDPANGLAQQLKVIARLISGGLKTPLYMVRLGGFDTHDAQVDTGDKTKGEHASLLKYVNDAILSFMQDNEALGTADRVVGMTFSEFGRTIMSNASNGTDHGTAAPMFIFGNAVAGGLTGTNHEIGANLTYDVDLDMKYDFRQVYYSMLTQWLGMSTEAAQGVLLDQFNPISIIKGADEVTGLADWGRERQNNLSVYPNPLNGQAKVRFESYGEPLRIDLVDLTGRQVAAIYQGTPPTGQQTIAWDTQVLHPGQYVVVLRTPSFQQGFRVVK